MVAHCHVDVRASFAAFPIASFHRAVPNSARVSEIVVAKWAAVDEGTTKVTPDVGVVEEQVAVIRLPISAIESADAPESAAKHGRSRRSGHGRRRPGSARPW